MGHDNFIQIHKYEPHCDVRLSPSIVFLLWVSSLSLQNVAIHPIIFGIFQSEPTSPSIEP